jgi:urea transport system permease protein
VHIALAQLVTGLSIAAVLLLIALGLTFTFGQMGVINMAHGEFIMAGAYTAYMLQGPIGHQSLLVAIPVAFLVAGALGLVLERILIRRFYGRPLDTLLVTYGVSLILQQLARNLFGAPNVEVQAPSWLNGGFHVAGIDVAASRLFILVVVAIAVVSIWLYLTRSPAGRRTRAVVENRQLAACTGIATTSVDRRTFFIGSGLAGVAGVGITLLGSIGPTLGAGYLVRAFLVVVVGGLGQLRGAVLAAIGLGLFQAYGEYWTNASVAQVLVFLAIVVFLQVRPQGLFVLKTRSLQ